VSEDASVTVWDLRIKINSKFSYLAGYGFDFFIFLCIYCCVQK